MMRLFDERGHLRGGHRRSSSHSRRRRSYSRHCRLELAPLGFFRLAGERLEERIMLNGAAGVTPPSIVVGRTLSIYDVPEVQNNQETIAFTVYNQAADPITGVLLTDTLANGVTFASASQLPDQNGQQLAWSLGTIQPYDRASVTLTVSLGAGLLTPPPTAPVQLETGASAYGTLDAGMVSWTTAPATLRTTVVAANLLASTPDANTTDPYVQEKAAELNYDPTQIYNFLQTQIGYNSYVGSLRGARGTLWSNAGNSLDDASLGVALVRASGIPAQYEEGTLTTAQAQQLILSMFPARYQTVGIIPVGTQAADPADDPQLLSETKDHFWFQFDAGSGMKDADPEFVANTIGQATTSPTNSFTQVPDGLRPKTEIKLTAEIYNQAAAAFGLSDGLSENVVLDQAFNDVDLVGHPLTIGNLVNSTGAGAVAFFSITNTYTPYLSLNQGGHSNIDGEMVKGTPYQEVLTNFPFSSQVLTGFFVDVTTYTPQPSGNAVAESVRKTLFDRIGIAGRQGGAPVSVNVAGITQPAMTDQDVVTLAITPSVEPVANSAQQGLALTQPASELQTIIAYNPSPDAATSDLMLSVSRQVVQEVTVSDVESFLVNSDQLSPALARDVLSIGYFDTPRIIAAGNTTAVDPTGKTATTALQVDLLHDAVRAYAAPGQRADAAKTFEYSRGLLESTLEQQVLDTAGATASSNTLGSFGILAQALSAPGATLVFIDQQNLQTLASLHLSPQATALITQEVQQGLQVLTPNQMTQIAGTPRVAWLQLNPATGNTVTVSDDGGHDGEIEQTGPASLSALEQAELAGQTMARGVLNYIRTHPNLSKKAIKQLLRTINDSIVEADANNLFIAFWSFEGGRLVDLWTRYDPPASGVFFNGSLSSPAAATTSIAITPTAAAGSVAGTVQAASVSLSHQVAANWSSGATSAFQTTSLSAAGASVTLLGGQPVGTGNVALTALSAIPIKISGSNTYSVSGSGSLAFYGSAETSLGVGGDWQSYTATVSGNTTLTLTTDKLTLNGTTLPPGTYVISASTVLLSGSGTTTSPNFAGSASITATGGTVEVGPGSGNLSVGGTAINTANETTLTGYNGAVNFSANGNGTDAVTLSGNATNVLTVAPNPATITTDQNTPVSFNANVQTSFADTYNVTANAPIGWNAAIDNTGKVTVTPAAGTQAGTYPIQIIAQSTTNSDLVSQATVEVTITPTKPGMAFSVLPDPIFTVPFNGAQLPTAFRATIQNTGPAADTYNLTFANLPTGFAVLKSATTVTAPAGQTGILGIYLQPTGSQLPSPGENLSFSVTATSATNPSITQTVNVPFTMPAVDAVTMTAPAQVASTPGTATTAALILDNVGNVSENVTLSAAATTGLTVSGLSNVSLAAGQTTKEAISLTPDSTARLNSILGATVTATYGPQANPQTATSQISLIVRSAQTVAISQSSVDAGSAGNSQLSGTLSELSDTISQLQGTPTDPNLISRTQLLLSNLSSELSADPVLAPSVTQLTPIQTDAKNGNTSDMLTAIPSLFKKIDAVLAVEAAEQFSVSVSPSEVDLPALTNQQKSLTVTVTDTGPDPVTLSLSTGSLPSGVTLALGQTQLTLQPGSSQNVSLTLTSNVVSTHVFTLDVHAVDSTDSTLASVAHDGTAIVAVRAAAANVLDVTVNPISVTTAGTPVAVSASIFDTANASRSVLAHITVLDSTNKIVASPPDVPITLTPTANAVTFPLGNLNTTGLANGVYTLEVSLRASDGTALPGKSSEAPFLVGIPITAGVSASPTTLPPGTSTVTTTVTVANTDPGQESGVGIQGSGTTNKASITQNVTTDPRPPAPSPQSPISSPQSLAPIPSSDPPTPPAFNPPAGDAVKWIGTTSGNWDVAANWLDTTTNANHVPDATDNVTIDATGLTITVETGNQVAQSLLLKSGTLNVAGGNLFVSSGAEIDGAVTLASNTLTLGGGAAIKGSLQWSGGQVNLDGGNLFNLGTMTLSNNLGLVSNNGGNTSNLKGTFFNEVSVVQQSGGLFVDDSIEIDNTSAGSWHFAGDASVDYGSFTPSIVNSGTFEKTSGTGTSNIAVLMTSTGGTFQADSGTLTWSSDGDVFDGSTFNAQAGGAIDLVDGNTNDAFSGTIGGAGAGQVLLSHGNLTIGAGGATFNFAPGLFQWYGATINLRGQTLTNAGSMTLGLATGADEALASTDAGQKVLGGNFDNTGTLTVLGSGRFFLYDKVILDNAAGGSLLLAGDGNLFVGGQTPSLTTAGTIEKTSGSGTSQFAVPFTYTGGSLKVDSGTLTLNPSGSQIASASFTVAGGATLDLTGGSSGNIFSGTFTGSGGGTVLLAGGSIVAGSSGATFNFPSGMFQWTGGGINLDGHTFTNSGSITLNNSSNLFVFANNSFTGGNNNNLGGTLNNSGAIVEKGGGSLGLYDSVALANQSGGTYTLATDAGIFYGNFAPTMSNTGTLEKSAGTGVSTIGVPLANLGGTLKADSGTLSLAGRGGTSTGGAFDVATGAILDLTGNTDGNVFTGTYTGTGAGTVLVQNGDFIIGAGGATFNFPDGMFQWTGGGINLFGHTLINAGTMTIANANNVVLYGNGNFNGGPNTGNNLGGTLENQGTIADHGPAAVLLFDSVRLKNDSNAMVTLTGGASLIYQNFSSAVTNAGSLQANNTTLVSTISAPLTNSGTVRVLGGELDLTSNVTNSGVLDARANTLKLISAVQNTGAAQTEGGSLNFAQGSTLDNTGTLKVNGGSATFAGGIKQDSSGYLTGGTWIASGGGTITLPANSNIAFNQGNIVLSGVGSSIAGIQPLVANDGAFAVTSGAVFTTAGNFTNSGTLTVGPSSTLSVTGNYTQTAPATLDVQLGGTPGSGQFGRLTTSGSAAFTGMLRSEFVNGYAPTAGDNFTVATYTSTSGSFSALALAETPTVAYTANVGATNLVLTSQAATLTPTQTTVASSAPGGAHYGQLVEYTATVTATGGGTPSGTVQFQIDGLNSGTPVALTSGQASLTIALPVGSHTITAFYISGNTQFADSDNSATPLIEVVQPAMAQPTTIELYYTTFGFGLGASVDKVAVTLGQDTLALGAPVPIVQDIPADGLIFLPNGNLLTASGTASEINPNTGAVTSVNGQGAEHLALDPSGTKVWTSPQPGPLVELPINPLQDGIVHTLTGDDINVTHLAFDNSGQAYYVSSGPGGFGSFGLIDLTTFTTKRVLANLPAAHGISYDPFTGDLFLVGSDSIVQIDPRTLQIVSQRDFPTLGSNFDQGANDGKGHLYVANNGGYLVVVDYSATGLVGNPNDFVATPFLQSGLDDVAPLSGLGGAGIPVTVDQHLVASGYNVNPTSITPASSSFTSSDVTWQTTFTPGQPETDQFQFAGQVTNMAPGEVRQISNGTTVTATVTASDGSKIPVSIQLAPLVVAAQHIIELTPPTETADQGATANYTVELSNPLPTDETYTLAIAGLPSGETASLAASVPVPAGKTVNVPLTISVPVGALQGTQAFLVSAQTAAGASDSVEGQLTVNATVAVSSLAVHATLTPSSAIAGQTNPALYTITVTNTGDATNTYTLSGNFPAGFTGTFSQTTISVPPGLSNFRDVQLAITPPAGAAAQDYPFTVTATSTTDGTVSSQAKGTATVAAQGVQVQLTPSSAVPGSTYQLKVTNTGKNADTFNLSLASPGALVSTLGTNQVTLQAGASQTVPVTTTAVNFADPGTLPLTGVATSQSNSSVQGQSTADLTIASTQSMTAAFTPSKEMLVQPGNTSFLLEVNNTGNTEDSYSATIVGTTGPVTANLVGLDGQPTQSVPLFILPGLSTGAILLQVQDTGAGQGTVTVLVQSLTNSSIHAAPTATVTVGTTTTTGAALTLANNTRLAVAEGASATLNAAILKTIDSDSSVTPANIIYTLTSAPTQGTLTLGSQVLANGGTFTQDDINSGRLSYKANEEGSDAFSFNVAASGAATINGTFLLAISDPGLVPTGGFTVSASEGSSTPVQTIATFTDPGGIEPQAGYTAQIDWGDGSSSAGTVLLPRSGGITAAVAGQHTYAEEGTHSIRVTLHHEGTPDATATSTAVVSDPAVAASGGFTYLATSGTAASAQTVAVFTDPGGPEAAGDYSANINWGDGSTAAGTISLDPTTHVFTVSGQHNYNQSNTYSIDVTLDHDAAPAATVASTADIVQASTIGPVIAATAVPVSGYEHSALQGVTVATFTDGDGSLPAADFTASIDWGDGSTSPASISLSGGTYTVAGSHTYLDEGQFTLHVSVSQTTGAPPAGNSATVTPTATMHEELLMEGGVGTPNQKYISEIYRDLFGRAAEPQGRDYWVSKLAAGQSHLQVATSMVQLAFPREYQRDTVDQLYQQYLGRAPDADGKAYWTAFLFGGGTAEQMSQALVNSAEFFKHSGANNDGFLAALFHDALGRSIDAKSQMYFDKQLAHGVTAADVAVVVFSSDEYHRRQAGALFEQLLDRPADPATLDTLAAELAKGMRDEQILAQLIAADDYFAKSQV